MNAEPKVTAHLSRLTNAAAVRRFLLATAAKTRHHKFTRVSHDTMETIEASLRNHLLHVVKIAPSRGCTL